MMHSATEATTQDARLSMDEEGDCNINEEPGGRALLQIAHNLTTHVGAEAPHDFASRQEQCRPRQAGLLHCAKMREMPPGGNFLPVSALTTKLTAGP
jgi:hypothetical protein